MKNLILCIIALIFLASCGVKKSITSSDVKTDTVKEKSTDTTIIKTRLVKQDSISATQDIDLSTLDVFKKYYSPDKPYTVYDSTGQTKIETYIDKNNHLKQKIITKPKDIPVSDTTKISHHDIKEVKSEIKNTKEVDVVQPSFFQRLWTTIKDFIWFIVIGAIIVVVIIVAKKFNLIGIIKTLL